MFQKIGSTSWMLFPSAFCLSHLTGEKSKAYRRLSYLPKDLLAIKYQSKNWFQAGFLSATPQYPVHPLLWNALLEQSLSFCTYYFLCVSVHLCGIFFKLHFLILQLSTQTPFTICLPCIHSFLPSRQSEFIVSSGMLCIYLW